MPCADWPLSLTRKLTYEIASFGKFWVNPVDRDPDICEKNYER